MVQISGDIEIPCLVKEIISSDKEGCDWKFHRCFGHLAEIWPSSNNLMNDKFFFFFPWTFYVQAFAGVLVAWSCKFK